MISRAFSILVVIIGTAFPCYAAESLFELEYTDVSGLLVTKKSAKLFQVKDLLSKDKAEQKPLLFKEVDGAKQYKEVVNQLASVFWSKFYLEQIPKMNRGLFREYSKGGLIYKEPADSSSCTSTKKSSHADTISGIYFSRKKAEGSMSVNVSYRGCLGEIVFTESISVKGTPAEIKDSDILSGSREYSLLPGEEKKTLSYNDKKYFEAFVVHSYRNKKGEIKTTFHSGGHVLVEIVYSPKKAENKEDLIITPFPLDFQHRFHNFNENYRMKMDFGGPLFLHVDYVKGYPRYYVYASSRSHLSSRSTFNSYLNQLVEPMISLTAKVFMDDFLFEFPNVITKTSGGGQKFKDDLNLFIIRLRSGSQSDKDLVILQIRNLLNSIDKGQFVYQDNRPTP